MASLSRSIRIAPCPKCGRTFNVYNAKSLQEFLFPPSHHCYGDARHVTSCHVTFFRNEIVQLWTGIVERNLSSSAHLTVQLSNDDAFTQWRTSTTFSVRRWLFLCSVWSSPDKHWYVCRLMGRADCRHHHLKYPMRSLQRQQLTYYLRRGSWRSEDHRYRPVKQRG